ncbi:MAG: methylated-DNA--[protein]-cysteine S-methyltransferase [Candidatus Eremiobacteraeota bacterium]|nr:methylated-DNA--[protein]-cysteine S-methyltransferase [Candidatus Eremiobacteraeota bacterium]MBC5828428.1 methylated-DNA--[protein]-cysteine S-methyltransferase [Candidatus Eremiobacteraeota bacterium]
MQSLEKRLTAFSPEVRPPIFPETDVSYAVTESPVGPLVLAATDAGLVTCAYGNEAEVTERIAKAISPRLLRSPGRLEEARRELDAYFEGRLRKFSVRVDLSCAAPFGRAVLESLEQVPYGATTSYASLARRIGNSNAARAVGGALGRNPICIIVPCHRVLRTGGDLGGYAGGLPIKRALLRLEGAALFD